MMKLSLRLIFILSLILPLSAAWADRIKDIATLAGVRTNQLVGYGLVVGLSGTGDNNLGITLQSMQAMLSRFGMSTDQAGLSWHQCSSGYGHCRSLPFMRAGQAPDVTVSALGGASSLRGGTLLMTPLLGADGQTYAIAQETLRLEALVLKARTALPSQSIFLLSGVCRKGQPLKS